MKQYRVVWTVKKEAFTEAKSKKEAEEKVLLGELNGIDFELAEDPVATLE
jgi:hypothetical protein